MTAPLVHVKDVTFKYPAGVTALKNVNLEVNKGEIVAIIGQNGSGKTTLAKHLNGLLKPDSGEVLINGVSTIKESTAKLSRIVGYVFQDPDDQIFMTKVYNEVSFGPNNLRFSKEDIKRIVKNALELTGLWELRNKHPLDLNLDDKKLTTIASIISMNPEVIILDEPTSGQDHTGIKKVKKIIKELSRKHTIILISHDMELVAKIATKIVVMLNGEIILQGTPKQVFVKDALLKKTYLKPPFITQLAHKLGMKEDILTINEFIEEVEKVRRDG